MCILFSFSFFYFSFLLSFSLSFLLFSFYISIPLLEVPVARPLTRRNLYGLSIYHHNWASSIIHYQSLVEIVRPGHLFLHDCRTTRWCLMLFIQCPQRLLMEKEIVCNRWKDIKHQASLPLDLRVTVGEEGILPRYYY